MVTAQPVAPKPPVNDDFTLGSWTVVPFKPPACLTDDLLERLGDLFAGCKIERTARGDLAVSPPNAHGGSPEYEVPLSAQVWLWIKADGFGSVASATKGYEDEETGSVHAPDVSWITQEQKDAAPAPSRTEGMFRGVPAFAIEILSKRDTIAEHDRRCRAWIARGVQVMWMLDPFNRTLRIYRQDDPGGAPPELLDAAGRIAVGPLMPGFEMDFDEVWAVW